MQITAKPSKAARWWRRYRPTFYFALDLGFFRVSTDFFYERIELEEFEYLGFRWQLFDLKGTLRLTTRDRWRY